MDIRSVLEIKITKNDRLYTFLLPMGAPYGEAFDACNEILIEISNMAKKAAENIKRDASA